MAKNRIRVEFILDESGSMSGQEKTVINGFNEQVQEMRKEEKTKEVEYVVSLTKFSSNVTTLFAERPLAEVKEITTADYKPDGMTALYDAVGSRIDTAEEGEQNVLVYIFTDGAENSSKKFSHAAVKELIDIRQKQGWGFTYFGADMDAAAAASSIGVANAVNYASVNMADALYATSAVRGTYTSNVSKGLVGAMRSCNLTADVDEEALNNISWTSSTTGSK
jgi:uncharacterized protein YegL